MDEKIPFTEEAVKEYLDKAISYWRKKWDEAEIGTIPFSVSSCYIDAFQSVRTSLFRELLPIEKEKKD